MASPQRENLGKEDLELIQEYLTGAQHKWSNIGVQLRLDPEQLESLKNSTSSSSTEDKFRRMILMWLEGEQCAPQTWRSLYAALRAPTVDEAEIARQIEREKLSSEVNPSTSSQDTPQLSSAIPNAEGEDEVPSGPVTGESSSLEPFPYLNTSGLSLSERRTLFEQLLQESMDVRLAFATLESETEISLLRNDVSGSKIQELLLSSDGNAHYGTALDGVKSLTAALGILRESWNFIDYGLLEEIITSLGSFKDREHLDGYRKSLAEFAKRRIFECPTGLFGTSTSEAEMLVTIKRVDKVTILYDTTLNQVQIFSVLLKKELGASSFELRLVDHHKVEDSLELKFAMPSALVDKAFPLSSEKREKLVSLGVWLVSCGDYIFRHEEHGGVNDPDGAPAPEVRVEETPEPEEETIPGNELMMEFSSMMTCEDEDMGPHMSICISNKKTVVEVSSGTTESAFKAYKVGRLRGELLQWKSGLKGVRYGTGKAPRIAMNEEGYVVEVDEESTNGDLSCRVGLVHSTNMMIWTEADVFTTGSNPSVALCSRTVVAAFKRGDDAFYRVGALDTGRREILWSAQEHRFLNGISELAIAANQDGLVTALYSKQMVSSSISSLYITTGQLNKAEKKVLFSTRNSLQSVSTGMCPSVAINRGNNILILSIQKKGVQKKLNYRLGVVKKVARTNAFNVLWSRSEGELDLPLKARVVSLAMNDKGTVLASFSNNPKSTCHIGKIHHETTL